jgi:hypothetical protein
MERPAADLGMDGVVGTGGRMNHLPPNRTRRSTSPVVLWVWSTLEYRSDADRWLVLCAARGSLTDARDARVEAHLRVLFRFRDQPGGNPPLSRRSYARWRQQQDDRDLLPSPTAIANTFGGWHDAADAIGQSPAPDVLSRRYTAQGPAFTTENLVDALTLWKESGPDHTWFSHYRAWALDEIHKPEPALPRIAICYSTFGARFGSWRGALEAAGLEFEPSPHPRRGPVTREQIIADLQAAAATRDEDGLPVNFYRTWRNRQLEARKSNPVSSVTVQEHFGTWLEGLGAAGILDRKDVASKLRRGGRRHPDGLVHRSLKRAMESQGRDLSRNLYRRWRMREIERGAKPLPPSDQSIRERHGSWHAAVKFTQDHWDERAPKPPDVVPTPDNTHRWHRIEPEPAIASLHRAMKALGHVNLGRDEYDQWRLQQDDRGELVAPTSISRIFGGWKPAIRAAKRAPRQRADDR